MHNYRLLACALFVLRAVAQAPAASAPKYEDLNAVLWVQKSIEYKHWTAALEQAEKFEDLPLAVILDLDETVLDNSPFMAHLVLSGQTFTEPAWEQWVNEARATALPGAVRFLNSAFLAGVAPVYITNRVCHPSDPADPTLQVLRQLRIPVSPE